MSDSHEAGDGDEPEPNRWTVFLTVAGVFAVLGIANASTCTKRTHADGEVTEVKGQATLAVGARCALRSYPFGEGMCFTRVECGETTLYGAGKSGYSTCDVGDEAVLRVSDDKTTPEGGDPMLELDYPARTAELRDEVDGETWSLTIVLAP